MKEKILRIINFIAHFIPQTVWAFVVAIFIKAYNIIKLKKVYIPLVSVVFFLHISSPLYWIFRFSENQSLKNKLESIEVFFLNQRQAIKSWRLPPIFNYPFYFFLPVSGIFDYKLTHSEKQQWNQFSQKILDDIDAFNEQEQKKKNPKRRYRPQTHFINGWLTFKNEAVTDRLEYSRFFANAGDYYFSKLRKVDLNQIKAIYLSASSLPPTPLQRKMNYSRAQKLNGLCYDIKDVIGFVTYVSDQEAITKVQGGLRPPIANLTAFNRHLYQQNFYSIARVTMFQDERLLRLYPDKGISRKDGGLLLTHGRKVWVDPHKKDVQTYNVSLLWEVASSHVAEIQLDYIRYPAEGNLTGVVYHGVKNFQDKPKILHDFLQKVHAIAKMYGIALSLDVFGVVAWQEVADIKTTGQDLSVLAHAADIMSPMLYPSHFGLTFGGIKNPGDHPFHFVYEGVRRMSEFLPKHIVIRPWLQAFAWRVSRYNADYIREQIRGAEKNNNFGYLLWNAANNYLAY